MNVAIQAHVYHVDGPRVVHLTVAFPEGHDLEITPEELDDLLAHSLAHDEDTAALPRLGIETLNAVAPKQVYQKRIKRGSDDCATCAVCLADFRPRMHVRRLPCGHLFCSRCIEKWAVRHNAKCPTCRAALH